MTSTLDDIFSNIRALCNTTPTHELCMEIHGKVAQAVDTYNDHGAETLLPYVLKTFKTWPEHILFTSHALCKDGIAFVLCLNRCVHLEWFALNRDVLHYVHRLFTFLEDDYHFMHGRYQWHTPNMEVSQAAVLENCHAIYDDFKDSLIDNQYGLLGYITSLSALLQLRHSLAAGLPLHDPLAYKKSAKWFECIKIIELYFTKRPLRLEDGLFTFELDEIQRIEGAPLPTCLVEFHQYFGRVEFGCDYMIPLSMVVKRDKTRPLIEFMVENQGCVGWAIDVQDDSSNPDVYRLQESTHKNDEVAHQFKAKDISGHWQVAIRTNLCFTDFVVQAMKAPWIIRVSNSTAEENDNDDDHIPF